MNIVMDEAVEVYVKDAKPKRELGSYTCSFTLNVLLNISYQDAFY